MGFLCIMLGAIAVSSLAGRDVSRSDVAKRAPSVPTRSHPSHIAASYLGPSGQLKGEVTLRARARAGRGRIVAVTFLIDGRPLGSDTTAPYEQEVDAGSLAPGRHRLQVVAVDELGRRAATQPATVQTSGSAGRFLTASPRHGLAAALAALKRGDVTVRLLPGHYSLEEVQLASGARLIGSGADTVLGPRPGSSYSALLRAEGDHIRISDLSLDGGGQGRGEGMAVAVVDGSSDVRLQRLRIERVRTLGIAAWGAYRDISVQDSRIAGGGTARAGVVALGSDRSRDASVLRTRVTGFRDYGISFTANPVGRSAARHSLALDNRVSDITNPATANGRNESGVWSGGVQAAIIGNVIRRTGWTGVETVGSSTRTSVVGNKIRKTRTGIYLEHSTNRSLFMRNRVFEVKTGINVEWRYGGAGSNDNTFTRNRLVSASEAGLFVDAGADGNRISDNVFVDGVLPAIVLQGSSENLVEDNRACGSGRGSLVEQRGARGFPDPHQNIVKDAKVSPSCRAP